MERLISQVAHVEIFTPTLEESTQFFVDLVGLEESERKGDSVYLRTWADPFHHTLVLTSGERTSLGHVGWRADGEDELSEIVSRLEASGAGEGWHDEAVGHGRAYRFLGPDGQLQEVFWDVDRWQAPPELASSYPSRPQRYTGRGAAARYLDHVNYPASDPLTDAVARMLAVPLRELYAVLWRAGVVEIDDWPTGDAPGRR